MRPFLLPCLIAVNFALSGCTDSSKIVGKYEDPKGNTVEFLNDGTMVVNIGAQQGVWKWTILDGGRLKLEPSAGLLGAEAAVCDYALYTKLLLVTGCEYAMRLKRT